MLSENLAEGGPRRRQGVRTSLRAGQWPGGDQDGEKVWGRVCPKAFEGGGLMLLEVPETRGGGIICWSMSMAFLKTK